MSPYFYIFEQQDGVVVTSMKVLSLIPCQDGFIPYKVCMLLLWLCGFPPQSPQYVPPQTKTGRLGLQQCLRMSLRFKCEFVWFVLGIKCIIKWTLAFIYKWSNQYLKCLLQYMLQHLNSDTASSCSDVWAPAQQWLLMACRQYFFLLFPAIVVTCKKPLLIISKKYFF